MNKIIFTDIDHTVLNFNAGFEEFLHRSKGIKLNQGWLGDSCRLYKMLGITEDEADNFVHDFFEDEGFATLPALEDAKHCLPRLAEYGWQFVAISACPESIDTKLRWSNLEQEFGIHFLDVIHSGYGGCKADILRSYEPSIWVEDNANNATIGHEIGYQSYLLNRSYNIFEQTPAKRVESWFDILVDIY